MSSRAFSRSAVAAARFSLLILMPFVMSNPWKMGISPPMVKLVEDVFVLSEYVLSSVRPRPNDKFSEAEAVKPGRRLPFAVLRSTSRCSTASALCLTDRLCSSA